MNNERKWKEVQKNDEDEQMNEEKEVMIRMVKKWRNSIRQWEFQSKEEAA